MKTFIFVQNKVILLNILICILIFFYIEQLTYGSTNRIIRVNDDAHFSFVNVSSQSSVNLNITNLIPFLNGYSKLQFGSSEAFLLQDICIVVNNGGKRYITLYGKNFDYSLNFNGIEISLNRKMPSRNKYTYNKEFNLFFVKGTPFITFPINMHHFFKDLAVDLFSVLRRLPHSTRAKNWLVLRKVLNLLNNMHNRTKNSFADINDFFA